MREHYFAELMANQTDDQHRFCAKSAASAMSGTPESLKWLAKRVMSTLWLRMLHTISPNARPFPHCHADPAFTSRNRHGLRSMESELGKAIVTRIIFTVLSGAMGGGKSTSKPKAFRDSLYPEPTREFWPNRDRSKRPACRKNADLFA